MEKNKDSSFEVNVPEYRPGKARFQVIYQNGRDTAESTISILELGDQRFYDEVFLGHMKGGVSPTKEIHVFTPITIQEEFLNQLREFGYHEVDTGMTFKYNGLTLHIL